MRVSLTITALALALSSHASAGEMTRIGDVTIADAWARPPQDVSNRGAVYMTLETTGEQADRLLGAETPAAEQAEFSGFWLEGCFAHRRSVGPIELAAGARTVLDPGGLHIVLTGPQQGLVEGKTVPLRLTFEKAGTVEIDVPVRRGSEPNGR